MFVEFSHWRYFGRKEQENERLFSFADFYDEKVRWNRRELISSQKDYLDKDSFPSLTLKISRVKHVETNSRFLSFYREICDDSPCIDVILPDKVVWFPPKWNQRRRTLSERSNEKKQMRRTVSRHVLLFVKPRFRQDSAADLVVRSFLLRWPIKICRSQCVTKQRTGELRWEEEKSKISFSFSFRFDSLRKKI